MRKISFLLLLVLILKIPVNAQTPFWEEDFNTGQDWSLELNWSITGTKMQFNWSPSVPNFDASAISPVITLPENVGDMVITQYLDVFSPTNEMAEISIIHDDGELVLWSYALSSGNWGSGAGSELEFPLEQFQGQNVQIKFRTFGNDTYNWNWWDVFSIKLYVYLDNDLAVSEISGPSQIEIMEAGTWDITIKNTGINPLADYTVKLFDHSTGNLIGSIDEQDVLEPQASKSFSFEWSSEVAFNTALYGFVFFEGDDFEANNTSESYFVRIKPDIDFNIFVWDNDNAIETMTCPVQGDLIQPSTALTRVLDEAGFNYESSNNLPSSLDPYDIIFTTMGCYCLS